MYDERSRKASLPRPALPLEPQAHLNVAAVIGGRNDARRDVRNVGVRESEIRMIQDVEEFCAILQLDALCKRKIFRHREVKITERRPDDLISPGIPLEAQGGHGKCGHIVPMRHCVVVYIAVTRLDGVDALRNIRAAIAHVGAGRSDRESAQ